MSYISPEGAVVPTGTDNWNLTADLRTMVASQRTAVPVTDITAAETVATAMASDSRSVSDTNPLVVFNNSIREFDVKNGSGWMNTAWATFTLSGAWVAYVGGGGYYNGLKYRKKDGMILIHGMIKSGAAGSTIATLPAGFYPVTTIIACAEANAAGTLATLIVSGTDGLITYRSGPAAPSYLNINLSLPMF